MVFPAAAIGGGFRRQSEPAQRRAGLQEQHFGGGPTVVREAPGALPGALGTEAGEDSVETTNLKKSARMRVRFCENSFPPR